MEEDVSVCIPYCPGDARMLDRGYTGEALSGVMGSLPGS